MDTSDSECFESADEDIQSDEELPKKVFNKDCQNLLKPNPNYELEASETLCDPRTEESKITRQNDASIKLEIAVKGDNESKNSNKASHSSSETEDICQVTSKINTINVIDDSKPVLSRKENVEGDLCNIKQVEQETVKKSRSCAKTKLGSKISKDTVKFEITPEKKKSKVVEKEKLHKTENNIISSVQIVENEKLKVDNDDQNLWDDEELDWGTETKLESDAKHNISKDNTEEYKFQPSPSSNTPQFNPHIGKKSENQSDNWGAWGSWGVSVLSTATQSVSSITSQLTNVIETGLGAADPEELARIDREEKRELKESLGKECEQDIPSEAPSVGFGLGNLVKLVENTGNKVISGGLDTLETIGKKTMEVLQEGDPGLKKKRAFLKIEQNKPVLSQILREAKERAENERNISEEVYMKKMKNYETLFDDHHGLVHLEALELLSKQCEIKLRNLQNSLNGEQYTEFLETMDQIKELCELPDEEEEDQISILEIREKLKKAVTEMNVQISYDKLMTNWEESEVWLNALNMNICDEKELHQQAIETLAQLTSLAMEQFHKIGELLLIKDRRSTADEADSLVQVTTTLTALIGIAAAKFSEKLNSKICESTNKEISGLITNVFFEAANSSSYIQDALQLLIPVLQVGAV
ncbi:hypothetical protein HHI36_010835 [Cryptolaemus montrouzieri]|uniref:Protein FAM114A2 n=1 Tax=Cryptolaemus montrouzieri TaxID=559131 RepID=A0ABD2MK16_9CUCU